MISVTESSASSSSSGPSLSASLNTSLSRRSASIPFGSFPDLRTCSTISWILSVAWRSSPARSTPATVRRLRSRRAMSSRWICSFTWRRTPASGSGGGAGGVSGRETGGSSVSCCEGPYSSSAGGAISSFAGLTRIIVLPIWTTPSGGRSTRPSMGLPLMYVPLALWRSSSRAVCPRRSRRAWRSETPGSGSCRAQFAPRPMR